LPVNVAGKSAMGFGGVVIGAAGRAGDATGTDFAGAAAGEGFGAGAGVTLASASIVRRCGAGVGAGFGRKARQPVTQRAPAPSSAPVTDRRWFTGAGVVDAGGRAVLTGVSVTT
jgi:hypothetical protein